MATALKRYNGGRVLVFVVGVFAEMSEDVSRICDITAHDLARTHVSYYKHRGALRGTPGSVCPQPEPNATELPSCTPISARAAQKWRQRRWWRGEEGARRPGPEGQATSCATSCGTSSATPSVTSCATSFTCLSFTCHPRASVGGGTRVFGVGSKAV